MTGRLKNMLWIVLMGFAATPLYAQDSIIFYEDFDVPNELWMDSSGTFHQAGFKDGYYVLSNSSRKEALGSYIVVRFDEERDYVISCKLGKNTGYDYNGYGLVFGRENEDNFYYFAISGGGKYKITRTRRGRVKTIKNWTYANEINRRNATNTLDIRRKEDKLHFYINDFQIEALDHPDYFGYEIGFRVDDYMNIQVYELTVKYPGTQD